MFYWQNWILALHDVQTIIFYLFSGKNQALWEILFFSFCQESSLKKLLFFFSFCQESSVKPYDKFCEPSRYLIDLLVEKSERVREFSIEWVRYAWIVRIEEAAGFGRFSGGAVVNSALMYSVPERRQEQRAVSNKLWGYWWTGICRRTRENISCATCEGCLAAWLVHIYVMYGVQVP